MLEVILCTSLDSYTLTSGICSYSSAVRHRLGRTCSLYIGCRSRHGPASQLSNHTHSPGLPVNGLHPRNPSNYMDYYSFTDPKGMEGWVGLGIVVIHSLILQCFTSLGANILGAWFGAFTFFINGGRNVTMCILWHKVQVKATMCCDDVLPPAGTIWVTWSSGFVTTNCWIQTCSRHLILSFKRHSCYKLARPILMSTVSAKCVPS